MTEDEKFAIRVAGNSLSAFNLEETSRFTEVVGALPNGLRVRKAKIDFYFVDQDLYVSAGSEFHFIWMRFRDRSEGDAGLRLIVHG